MKPNDFFATLMDPEGREVGVFHKSEDAEAVAAILNQDRPGFWVRDFVPADPSENPDTDEDDQSSYDALLSLSLAL